MREIVYRTGKRCEVKNAVDFARDLRRFANVVFDEIETGAALKMGDIFPMTCDQIVQNDYVVALIEEPFAEVRPNESGGSGDGVAHFNYRTRLS